MPIKKDLATLIGHNIPLNHLTESIIWDIVTGKNLREKITELETIVSGLVYKGTWDASTGVYPAPAAHGDWWIVGTSGTAGGEVYDPGDWIIHNGSVFEKVDNTDVVKTVNNVSPVNGNITLTKADIGLGNVPNLKHNFTAISNPNNLSDSTLGYSEGSRWQNTATDNHFVLIDATPGAAVWEETTQLDIVDGGSF